MPGALGVAALFFALLGALVLLGKVSVIVVAAYGLLSAVAFLLYRGDKSAATQGRRRTPESTLHTVDVVGGWPGALVARRVFRHKTVKQPFRSIFWVTVVANCLALAAIVWAGPFLLT
ncbi:DUF1294 domain-containing protein [Humibacillus xanthopallidus]|uniref:DUF1294 domain-containing protein n=1 Tax=Humibacillus xanthopallidus TaxID=412689 RepID=UPI001FE94407|nr:DUF1294 domain-containing protein [Humibacillus xanthopallidus]